MKSDHNTPKFCIIGAGPTGLGAAYRLADLGVSSFEVFEKNDFAGGLAATQRDTKGFMWDFAVHVVHSHYRYFDRMLEAVLPGGYYTHQRRSWVRMENRYIPYPFQYNIRHLSPESLWDCVDGLLGIDASGAQAKPAHFKEWVETLFGAGIARHFMLPYNRKIWTVEPEEMAYQWIGERVPTIDVRRVMRNVIMQEDDVAWGPNATFQFPKEGGTGAIWQHVADALPEGKLHLNHDLVEIDTECKTLHFANGRKASYDHLISTIPIPECASLCGWDGLEKRARQLRHSHVYVVGVGLDHPIPDALKDKTWIYCPGDECEFYRVTPFSTFSPVHVPDPERNCSLLCEISAPAGKQRDEAWLRREALDGLRRSGLLSHVPEDTHTYLMDAPYGYPIPTLDRDAILEDVLGALESKDIYSRGRFGGWKYEVANMDHSFMQGVEAIDRILNDTPERTLPTPAVVNASKQ